jgi:Uma2 family endonuclease
MESSPMSRTATIVGPEDHGRRMTLEEFDHAEVRGGYLYELSRGVITVSDVPGRKHLQQVHAINRQLYLYQAAHPEVIRTIGGGSDCKILAEAFESERHPDIFVYKTQSPDSDDIWSVWVPEIVVEVVSPSSEKRDYEEKPPEYLAFGVSEYWIFDEPKQQVTVLQRAGGRWRTTVLTAAQSIKTRLLPGFELSIATIFAAAANNS